MIETILLASTNIVIIAFLVITQYLYAKERKDLIRSLLAKNLQEITDAELIDKLQPDKEEKPVNKDLKPLDDLTDSEFDRMIKQQLDKVNANGNND